MTYSNSAPLQVAIFGTLTADPGLTALVGGDVFDELPPGVPPDLYVVLGAEDVRDRSHQTGALAEHRITISVVGAVEGFSDVKTAAGAVTGALLGAAPPALGAGRVVSLSFLRARARRVRAGQTRRIDLIFRALVEDD